MSRTSLRLSLRTLCARLKLSHPEPELQVAEMSCFAEQEAMSRRNAGQNAEVPAKVPQWRKDRPLHKPV